MEEKQQLLLFIVIASSAVILLLIAVVFDIFLLYRKRKLIAIQEKEIHRRKIDELIREQELNSVNALLKGQNAERRRISQELHDRLGGMLFMAKQYFKQLDKKIREIQKEQAETYDKFSGLLDEVVDEVRRISHDLYEGSLQIFGYSVALKQLVAAVTESNDLEIRLDLKDFPDSLEVDDQHELYAITQEMLSNTLKHAQATEINIEMQEGENELTFTYSDNGRGFDPETAKNGIGIENIRDRVKKIKGKFNIFSGYDEGTKFIIIIPRRVEDQSEHSR